MLSHIAMAATFCRGNSGRISHKIDTLVTLGTPIRPDYQFNEAAISLHLNVFSYHDAAQPSGGVFRAETTPFGDSFVRFDAERQLAVPGVRNLDATSQAGGHSELWNKPGTWDKIVVPALKK